MDALTEPARDAGYLESLALADTGESDTPAGRALADTICALDEAIRHYAARHKQRMHERFDEYVTASQ